jgi:hypothetical protein
MNIWIKSFAALSLFAGPALFNTPAEAAPITALPAPAPAQEALNNLASRAGSPLPSGTKLLSIPIVDGLATANFSKDFRDNFTGGDSDETHTVNAILRTLGQFHHQPRSASGGRKTDRLPRRPLGPFRPSACSPPQRQHGFRPNRKALAAS